MAAGSHPRLIFMGTPDFGVPTLRHLAQAGFPVAAVVTGPDKPQGRGYQTSFSPVKRAAQELGAKILQPSQVNEPAVVEQLRELRADVLVVAAYGQILKAPLLTLAPLGAVNLHASLLPKYRGAAPIQWAIIRGETETGVTVQRMAERVDSGDILVQDKTAIHPDQTAADLFARLSALGGPLMAQALDLLAREGRRAGTPQDESQATFAPRLSREDGHLDWTQTALELHNRVRGVQPWPGAYTEAAGETLKILLTKPGGQKVSPSTPAGSILKVEHKGGWLVAAGQGTTLHVLQVQCENSRQMTAQAFTCGYRVGPGSVLGLKGE
ncbi:MAG: methionyl-tRNA formyltransferase [candidate division FCPU426 bacterium]